jgi:hypothetical protein
VPPVAVPVNALFGGEIELVGYTLRRDANTLFIDIIWRSASIIHNNYKFFVHGLNESGIILEQVDTMPVQNTYPTSLWTVGEVVTESYQLPFSAELRRLHIGIYDPETMARLTVTTAAAPTDFIDIALSQS